MSRFSLLSLFSGCDCFLLFGFCYLDFVIWILLFVVDLHNIIITNAADTVAGVSWKVSLIFLLVCFDFTDCIQLKFGNIPGFFVKFYPDKENFFALSEVFLLVFLFLNLLKRIFWICFHFKFKNKNTGVCQDG